MTSETPPMIATIASAATTMIWPRSRVPSRVPAMLVRRIMAASGIAAGVGKSSFGQRYSTLRIDWAVSVTPPPPIRFPINGVIGAVRRLERHDREAADGDEVARVGVVGRPVRAHLVEADAHARVVELDDRRLALGPVDDRGLVLVHDRHACAFARGVGQRVVGEHGPRPCRTARPSAAGTAGAPARTRPAPGLRASRRDGGPVRHRALTCPSPRRRCRNRSSATRSATGRGS